jgi:hypothetical protein
LQITYSTKKRKHWDHLNVTLIAITGPALLTLTFNHPHTPTLPHTPICNFWKPHKKSNINCSKIIIAKCKSTRKKTEAVALIKNFPLPRIFYYVLYKQQATILVTNKMQSNDMFSLNKSFDCLFNHLPFKLQQLLLSNVQA